MSEIKLCRDCKWHRLSFMDRLLGFGKFAKCAKPELQLSGSGYPLVNGGSSELTYCATQRERKLGCGPEGKMWEPKRRQPVRFATGDTFGEEEC